MRREQVQLGPGLPELQALHPSVRMASSRELRRALTGFVPLPAPLQVRAVASASPRAGGKVGLCGRTSVSLGSVVDAENLSLPGCR